MTPRNPKKAPTKSLMFKMRVDKAERARLDFVAEHHGLGIAEMIRLLLKKEERRLLLIRKGVPPLGLSDARFEAEKVRKSLLKIYARGWRSDEAVVELGELARFFRTFADIVEEEILKGERLPYPRKPVKHLERPEDLMTDAEGHVLPEEVGKFFHALGKAVR